MPKMIFFGLFLIYFNWRNAALQFLEVTFQAEKINYNKTSGCNVCITFYAITLKRN